MENKIVCPKCGSDYGYYENIIQSYSQYFKFDKYPNCAGEFHYIKGGKLKYCANCNKNITEFVNSYTSNDDKDSE